MRLGCPEAALESTRFERERLQARRIVLLEIVFGAAESRALSKHPVARVGGGTNGINKPRFPRLTARRLPYYSALTPERRWSDDKFRRQ